MLTQRLASSSPTFAYRAVAYLDEDPFRILSSGF